MHPLNDYRRICNKLKEAMLIGEKELVEKGLSNFDGQPFKNNYLPVTTVV